MNADQFDEERGDALIDKIWQRMLEHGIDDPCVDAAAESCRDDPEMYEAVCIAIQQFRRIVRGDVICIVDDEFTHCILIENNAGESEDNVSPFSVN